MKAHHEIKNGVSIPGVEMQNKGLLYSDRIDSDDLEKVMRRIAAIEKAIGYNLKKVIPHEKKTICSVKFNWYYNARVEVIRADGRHDHCFFAFNDDDTIDFDKSYSTGTVDPSGDTDTHRHYRITDIFPE